MTPNPVELRPRSVGEIFGLTFGLYRRNFPLFIGIAAVVLVPILIVSALSQFIPLIQIVAAPEALADSELSSDVFNASLFGLTTASFCLSALALALAIFWPWMEGALSFNVIERILGRAPGLRAAYRQTRPRWGALWGSNILAQIGIGLPVFIVYVLLLGGLIVTGVLAAGAGSTSPEGVSPVLLLCLIVLFIPVFIAAVVIPIVLAINWTFRAPVIVGEGVDGIQALSRSAALTRGDRWRIFGRYILLAILEFIVLVVPALVISFVLFVGALASQATTSLGNFRFDAAALPTFVAISVVSVALSFVGSLLLTPFRIIFTTINYLDLRIRKENLAEGVLNAISTTTASTPTSVTDPMVTTPSLAASVSPVNSPAQPAETSLPPAPISDFKTAARTAPVNMDALTPGQRIGILFNRIRTEGENAQLLGDLGLAFMEIGDLGGAMDAFERARVIAPRDADVAYNLMVLHVGRRDMRAARQMMAEYVRLETNPDDLAAVRNNPRFKDVLPDS